MRQFGKSVIYKRKNNGPSTDPWGTPHLIWEASDKQPLAKHLCDRSCKYEVNHSFYVQTTLTQRIWMAIPDFAPEHAI